MGTVIIAGLCGFLLTFLINVSTGMIADAEWSAVIIQPAISAVWVLGVTAVIKGPGAGAAYVLCATMATAAAIAIRKRKKGVE